MLTPPIAQEIAGATSAIIGLNVLITDRDGIVIGSGDIGRVGGFHEASMEVIRTLRAASHGPAAAHRLIGVQPGITLPILLNNEAVGTVGITGDPEQVERFGLLVRNQAEILLRESLLLRSRLLRENAIEDLLRDLAQFDRRVTEADFIVFKAAELGYDLRLRRTVVVLDVAAPDAAEQDGGAQDAGAQDAPGEPAALQSAVLRAVRRAFSGGQDIVGAVASGRFAVLHHPARDDPAGYLMERCRALADDLARTHGVRCRAGVGGVVATVPGLHEGYRDATNALYLASRLRGSTVTHIVDVRAYDLLATVPQPVRARFSQAVLGPLREQPDWPAIRATLTTWCESGFNLVRAATALRVHRNTLVYRLNKIEALAGTGTRDPRTSLTLYLACLLDELDAPAPGDR